MAVQARENAQPWQKACASACALASPAGTCGMECISMRRRVVVGNSLGGGAPFYPAQRSVFDLRPPAAVAETAEWPLVFRSSIRDPTLGDETRARGAFRCWRFNITCIS